jgi:hypothetical protein
MQTNNVEQIYIPAPSIDTTYQVRIQAKSFTERSTQNISLVITSGAGLVGNKRLKTSIISSAYNSLLCASNEQMLIIRKSDRGGDGWNNSYYSILNEKTLQIIFNSSMTNTPSLDIISYDYICLEYGIYNISLHPPSSVQNYESYASSLIQMGVTVDLCNVYLSVYQTSAILNLTAWSKCNICEEINQEYYSFEIILMGSLYGVPYGESCRNILLTKN